jgi:hypothetical protein
MGFEGVAVLLELLLLFGELTVIFLVGENMLEGDEGTSGRAGEWLEEPLDSSLSILNVKAAGMVVG